MHKIVRKKKAKQKPTSTHASCSSLAWSQAKGTCNTTRKERENMANTRRKVDRGNDTVKHDVVGCTYLP